MGCKGCARYTVNRNYVCIISSIQHLSRQNTTQMSELCWDGESWSRLRDIPCSPRQSPPLLDLASSPAPRMRSCSLHGQQISKHILENLIDNQLLSMECKHKPQTRNLNHKSTDFDWIYSMFINDLRYLFWWLLGTKISIISFEHLPQLGDKPLSKPRSMNLFACWYVENKHLMLVCIC